MKKLSTLFALLGVIVFAGGAAALQTANSVGVGHGIVLPHPSDTNPCPGSTLMLNADGSYENGFAWQYGGVVPPYFGAFAEGYTATGTACGMQLSLSTLSGYYTGQVLDAFVWDAAGGNPNNVLTMTTGVAITPPAVWPNITLHDIDVTDAAVSGDFFIGYWGNWPGQLSGWFVGADLDGFGGLPRTNVAPGIGYPTGWQDPSVIWGPTQALGIGAYVVEGPPPVPTEAQTWGRIKQLYN